MKNLKQFIETTIRELLNEALFGRLDNDIKAHEMGKKLGLMIDEYGVVYGWDGQSFL